MPLTDFTSNAYDSLSYEPQRQNAIVLCIVGVDYGGQTAGTFAGDTTLSLAMESFPLPKSSINPIEVKHLNEKRKFTNPNIYDLMYNWYKSVHDPITGKTGLASAYKKNGAVLMYDPTGAPVKQWNLWGIWPSSFDPGDSDQTNEDIVRMNCTLSVDKCTLSSYPGSLPGAWPTAAV